MVNHGAVKAPLVSKTLPRSDAVKLEWKNVDGSEILELTNTIILHLAFVGDDLLVACDSNLELYFYGEDSITDRRLRGKSFSDYGYSGEKLDPAGLIYGPVVVPNCRQKINELAKGLHGHIDATRQNPSAEQWMDLFSHLDEIVIYKDLIATLKAWASQRQITLEDICVVIIPDEALFLLPLTFMGSSHGEPLITQLGGVTIGLSLLALKWSAQKYHWYTCPNMEDTRPRCALFVPGHIPNFPKLDMS